MQKVRWGVLGVAHIATQKVIPAMQLGTHSEVVAIASRDLGRAQAAAGALGIARAYGSYDDLLADAAVDAVYIPLPNHLHVPLSIRAVEAGKHVLCEKPVALSVAEIRQLIAARDRAGVLVGEAFMVRTNPQWIRVRELVRTRAIGDLRAVIGAFSYMNRDPKNVRNVLAWGGGGLMDIGCYPIQIARFLFESEPLRVAGTIERDPDFGTDRLTSGVLDFGTGHALFTCSTQATPYQGLDVIGATRRVHVEVPFTPPPDRPARVIIDDGSDFYGGGATVETFDACNQYTIQGDLFSLAILRGGEVPTPLEDSLGTMSVIERIVASA